MLVDADGLPVTPGARPSAETGLHCQIYRAVPASDTLLHGHSAPATVLSMLVRDGVITLAGYELPKAFEGQATHDAAVEVPVFDAEQDITRLAHAIAPYLPGCCAGYLISGHGAYVWRSDTDTALAQLGGRKFFPACEFERRKTT